MGLLAEFPGIPVIPLTGEGRGPGGACQPNVGQLGQFFPENPFIMVGGAARTARNRGMTAMPVWQTISVLALRPLVSGAAHAVGMSLADDAMDGVTKFLAERLGDPQPPPAAGAGALHDPGLAQPGNRPGRRVALVAAGPRRRARLPRLGPQVPRRRPAGRHPGDVLPRLPEGAARGPPGRGTGPGRP